MLAFLANLLGGGIVGQIADAFKARENAKTDAERIAADERIKRLQSIRDVQIAEAGSRINAIFRGVLALGPAVYLFKIFVIDKVVCQTFGWTSGACRTDDLTPEQWTVVTAVIGFFFLYDGVIGGARIMRGRK